MKVILQTTYEGWGVDTVANILDSIGSDEELAMYINGNDVTFVICPRGQVEDFTIYGECIETWIW